MLEKTYDAAATEPRIAARWEELLTIEADIVARLPIQAALH